LFSKKALSQKILIFRVKVNLKSKMPTSVRNKKIIIGEKWFIFYLKLKTLKPIVSHDTHLCSFERKRVSWLKSDCQNLFSLLIKIGHLCICISK
jgi:hypothetical protein